jgi:type IV pilus assembly protein PilC
LIAITGQLAAIVRANAPIIGGLEAASLDAPNGKLESIFLALRDDVAAGLSISEAMRRRPRFFPRFYTDLVKVGEETGRLDEALSELAEDVLQTLSLQDAITGCKMYIGMVLLLQLTIAVFLSIRVLPIFMGILADFEVPAPRPVSLFVAFTNYLIAWKWLPLLVITCLVLVGWKVLIRRDGAFSAAVGALFAHLPLFGGIVAKRNLGHVALVMEKLVAAGVPLDAALEDVASLDVNPTYRSVLRRVKERVHNGETLRSAMEIEKKLPVSFRGLISVGESSGLLPEALARIGRLYQRDAAKTSKIVLDVTAPLGVVALGCLGLLIALSWFAMAVVLIDTLATSV